MAGLFDSTATGLTIGADTYVTNETLMSLRYDNLDAGGILDQRKSATFVVVPAGRHQVTVWHETLGTLQREVTVPTQGDVSITIEFP